VVLSLLSKFSNLLKSAYEQVARRVTSLPGIKFSVEVEETARQVGTQSAIIAGFAFTGLTSISFETCSLLISAFATFTAATIAFELLALFISGLLLLMQKTHNGYERYMNEIIILWQCYTFGIISFVISVMLIAWIKFKTVAMLITGISVLALLVGVAINYKVMRVQSKP
jgi:hypothetical protein